MKKLFLLSLLTFSFGMSLMCSEPGDELTRKNEKKIWVADAGYKRIRPFETYCNICKNWVHGSTLNEFLMHLLNKHKDDNVKSLTMKDGVVDWMLKYSYEYVPNN